MAFLTWISFKLKYFIRYSYWLHNLNKAKIGKGTIRNFPIILEGKGDFTTGSNCILDKGVELGIGTNARIVLGDKNKLSKNVLIRIAPNKELKTGEGVTINNNTQIYIHDNWLFGDQVSVATNCSLLAREPKCYGKLILGNGVSIGDNCILDLSGDITIGNDVAIGPNCVLYTHDHNYQENFDIPWHGKPVVKGVSVGNGCWIGSGVTILPGVKVGKGAIVAAGAVLTKDVETFTLVGGVPARFLKKLK